MKLTSVGALATIGYGLWLVSKAGPCTLGDAFAGLGLIAGGLILGISPLFRRPSSPPAPPPRISLQDLAAWMAPEIAALDPEQLAVWEQIRVTPYVVLVARPPGLEKAFAVAQLPDGRIVFFDDLEDGFELSRPDADGVLRDFGASQFELQHITSRAVHADASG